MSSTGAEATSRASSAAAAAASSATRASVGAKLTGTAPVPSATRASSRVRSASRSTAEPGFAGRTTGSVPRTTTVAETGGRAKRASAAASARAPSGRSLSTGATSVVAVIGASSASARAAQESRPASSAAFVVAGRSSVKRSFGATGSCFPATRSTTGSASRPRSRPGSPRPRRPARAAETSAPSTWTPGIVSPRWSSARPPSAAAAATSTASTIATGARRRGAGGGASGRRVRAPRPRARHGRGEPRSRKAFVHSGTCELRDLPSVDELLRDPRLAAEPHAPALAASRAALARAREEIGAGVQPGDLVERALAELEAARRPRLRRVLNATGVIVHTNLGRAPLADAALARVAEVGARLLEPRVRPRGGRARLAAGPPRRRCCGALTGAEAALVVNNNAAAVLLALAALAEGREVIVSRGELIEIGDGFRIPDVLARSGARLVEVGTTNRTRAADYEHAIGARDGGAPARAPVELPHRRLHRAAAGRGARARRARAHGLAARRRPRLGRAGRRSGTSRLPRESLAAGSDLVVLLRRQAARRAAGRDRGRARRPRRAPAPPPAPAGAPRGQAHARGARGHARALPSTRPSAIPVLRMLREDAEAVRARAERLAALVGGEVEETVARVGGGALPLAELPSCACALEEALAAPLRAGEPPVVGRRPRRPLRCSTAARCRTPRPTRSRPP